VTPTRPDIGPDAATHLLDVTVLLPCRDEGRTVGDCVSNALAWIARRRLRGEVVVVDNASSDDSARRAAEAGARVVWEGVPGYGLAIRAGIAAARGSVVVLADADGTYDVSNLDPFYDGLIDGAGVVVGNRFADGSPAAMTLTHRIGNLVLSWLTRRLTGLPVTDVHCGIRSFRQAAASNVAAWSTGMEFATHMLVHAHHTGARIIDTPATLRSAVPGRGSHLRPVPDGFRHLAAIIRSVRCPQAEKRAMASRPRPGSRSTVSQWRP
jgi:glycosyltransferase involved in cell wall biosynthesis